LREVELQNVAEIVAGQSPKSEFYNEDGEGVPFFQGKADFGKDYPTVTTWCTKPKKMAKKGDILFSVRAPVGPTNIADIDCCIGRGLSAIRPGDDIDRSFLRYYFKKVEKKISDRGRGSTFNSITQKDLKALNIPLPSLSEQKAIVGKLDRAQRLIDIDKEMLAKYDKLIQSVFLEMFGDVALNPKNWKRKPIKDLLATKKIKRENPKKTKKVYDYISISDVDNELKRIVGHTAIDKTDAPSRARQLLKPNDVLVSTVRPNLNAVALYKSGLSNPIASTGFCLIRPDIEIINPHYLFQISKSRYFVSELSLIANGASYPAVTDQDILNLEIPLPPLNEQNRFEEIIEKISQEYRVTQANQKKSKELFSSLVQGAFG